MSSPSSRNAQQQTCQIPRATAHKWGLLVREAFLVRSRWRCKVGCKSMHRGTYAQIVRLGQLVHCVLLGLRGHNLLVAADGPGLGKVAKEKGLNCQLARLMHPIPACRIASATGSWHRSIRFYPPVPIIRAAECSNINGSRAPSSPKCLRGDSNPRLGGQKLTGAC